MSKRENIKKTPDHKLMDTVVTMMGQLRMLGIWKEEPTYESIQRLFGKGIRAKLFEMGPAARGEIADLEPPSTGRETNAFRSKYGSGRDIITEIAFGVIVWRMHELLKHQHACWKKVGHGRPPWSQSM